MSSKPFTYYLRVRYGECDAQMVVFTARYGDYISVAALEFFIAAGFPLQRENAEIDVQLVQQTTQWRAPARFYDVLEITVETRHIGNTSFTLAMGFRVAGHPATIATSETVYVSLDAKTMQKQPITPEARIKLQQGAPGKVVDHAAYLTST